jgi:hypothetical protein
MHKIEGGFILDDSELSPYGVKKEDNKKTEPEDTKQKEKNVDKD